MSQVTLSVPDISCAHCEKTILGVLQGRQGVRLVQVSIPGKSVQLDYDENVLTIDEVKEVLDDEGYPVTGTKEGFSQEAPRRGFIPLLGK